jgi:outer membrane receptor protein involved in Fe transport
VGSGRKNESRRVWPAATVAASLVASVAHAGASTPSVRLRIAAKPVRAALIDFALQADLSLGGDLDLCVGEAPALAGRMPIDTALKKLLAHSGCGYVQPDIRTIVVRKAEPPPPRVSHPTPRVAPPSPSDSPTSLAIGEIVITAQRYPNLPGRTPYGISVVSGETIDREGVASMSDLSGQVAGMTVTNLGPGRDKILLRGLSDGAFTGQTQSMVALYLDDVPITYNAPDPNLRLADIDRVEVMRGPQGTLYGGGSLGGVLRIATRQPDLDGFDAMAMVGLSQTAHGGIGTELESMVNLPLLPGRLALRTVAYRDSQDGYINNPALGLSHINGSQREGFRAALSAALSSEWVATFNVTDQSIHNDDTQYAIRRLGRRVRDNLVREPHDNDFDRESLTLNGEGDWGRLTASIAKLAHHFDSRYDASTATALYGLPSGPAALDEAKSIDLTIAEATYTTPQDRRWRALLGVFASTGSTKLRTALGSYPLVGDPAYAEARKDKINETAVYGELTFDITSRLAATAGLRWFDYRFDTLSVVTQAAGQRLFDGSDDAEGVSPKVLLSYRARPNVLVYAQAAEGYRPGGYNTAGRLGQIFDQPRTPHRRYEPDELWNYEIGAKARWWGDRLQTRLALFYATWNAVQSDQYLSDGTAYTANIGNGENRGVEAEGAWRVNSHLDLRAATILNDPEINRPNATFGSRRKAGLPGVSRVAASTGFDYHRDVAQDRVLRVQGQFSYVGNSYITFDANKMHKMGKFLAVRAGAAWETPSWTLTATIDIPLGGYANSFSFGNPFLILRDRVVTPPRPRTIAVRLSSRF